MKLLRAIANRREPQCALAAVFITAIIIIAVITGIFENFSAETSDALYFLKPGPQKISVIAIDDKSLQDIGRWPWNRTIHAELINNLQKYQPKAIGIDISFFEKAPGTEDEELSKAINSSKIPIVLASEFLHDDNKKKYFVPAFSSTAIEGHVNFFTDPDGVVRTLPSQIDSVQSFSYAVSSAISEKPIVSPLWIRTSFYEPPTITSYSDVLSNKTKPEIFEGAIILVGVTAPDFHDDHAVPVQKSRRMPGVVLHANAIQTIMSNDFLQKQRGTEVILYSLLIIAITAILFLLLKPYTATIGLAIMLAGYIFLSLKQFRNNIVYDVFHPVLAGVLTFIALILVLYFTESRHKKWISEVFGKYVSKSVANEILSKVHTGEDITLTGARKTVTVMFADVRGFTSISEKLEPEKVVVLLNTYLKDMTKEIFSEDGTLDKYLGDGIMAVWNSPADQKDHALMALRAALKMQKSAQKIAKSSGRNIALNYGIGISTGPAIVGNMGSSERLEYTAIGDTVNLASRLCGIAKSGEVLITEETMNLAKNKFFINPVGKVPVKGKKSRVAVYKVISEKV